MDGRERRTQRIIGQIKESALQLFSAYGVEKVSMDEIAQKANVSKVTIYNHFHGKEELLGEVLNLYTDRVFAATEEVLNSDRDFLEKLKLIMVAKVDRPQMATNDHLFELLESDAQGAGTINRRLKEIILQFFEEGKRQGYIDESIPVEIIYLYSEVCRAGIKAKLAEVEYILNDPDAFRQMLDLYFFGIIKRKPDR